MVYHNPHITGQYNPLYTLNNQGFSLLNLFFLKKPTKNSIFNHKVGPRQIIVINGVIWVFPKIVVPPKSSHFNRVFHYSIFTIHFLGGFKSPYFWFNPNYPCFGWKRPSFGGKTRVIWVSPLRWFSIGPLLGCPWYLVNGLVHPYISRLISSPK